VCVSVVIIYEFARHELRRCLTQSLVSVNNECGDDTTDRRNEVEAKTCLRLHVTLITVVYTAEYRMQNFITRDACSLELNCKILRDNNNNNNNNNMKQGNFEKILIARPAYGFVTYLMECVFTFTFASREFSPISVCYIVRDSINRLWTFDL